MLEKSAFWKTAPDLCETAHIQFRLHLGRAPIVPVVSKSDGHTEVEVTPGGAKVWVFDSNELWTSALNEVDFGAALFVVDKGECKPPSRAFMALLSHGLTVGFYGLRSDVIRFWRQWQYEHTDQISLTYVPCNDSTYHIPCIFLVCPIF